MKYEWKSPEELSKWMRSNIKYGHSSNWKLRSPEEVINSKKGDCHDQSLLEYEVLKSLGYKAGRLFMVEYSSWNQPGGATHTACWYEKSNKYYWFENAWGGEKGIHGPYKSLDELKSAIADEWNWSGKNDKLYMGSCAGVKAGMDLGEYVSAVTPEKESSKVFYKSSSNISSQENCSFLNAQDYVTEIGTVLEDGALSLIALVIFGSIAAQGLSDQIKGSSQSDTYNWAVGDSDNHGAVFPTAKIALVDYAAKHGVKEGAKNVLYTSDSSLLNKKVKIFRVYKSPLYKDKVFKEGAFEDLCKAYGIDVKQTSVSNKYVNGNVDINGTLVQSLAGFCMDGKMSADDAKRYNGYLKDIEKGLDNFCDIGFIESYYKASAADVNKLINDKSNQDTADDYGIDNFNEDEDVVELIRNAGGDAIIYRCKDKQLYEYDHETGKAAKISLTISKLLTTAKSCYKDAVSLLKSAKNESTILEEKRLEIPTKEFGVPSKRKFPLTDAKHVKSAIKFFNYVDEEDEAELARNIKRKAKDFGVVIRCGKQNRLSKYISKEYINEFMAVSAIGNDMYAICNGNIKQHISQGDHIISATDSYPYIKKEKKKKDPVDRRISMYMGDGEKLTVNESSSDKVPIYIIAFDYSSIFANTLKMATHSHFNHISIALSPDLNKAYTFARSVNGNNSKKGFTIEPLSSMIKEHGDFIIKVNAVYVNKNQYKEIKECIEYYVKHKDDTSYNYGNLVKAVFKVGINNDDLDDDSMNCSIFVDYILKKSGVDITDNPNSNLVFPEHLANADNGNDNVITVYYGKASGYNKKKIERINLESSVIEEVKTPKACNKCGSSNIGVFIKGEPVYICKDCGAYNGDVPFKESTDDDTFFDNIMKEFENLDMEPIPTDIFHEEKDQP